MRYRVSFEVEAAPEELLPDSESPGWTTDAYGDRKRLWSRTGPRSSAWVLVPVDAVIEQISEESA